MPEPTTETTVDLNGVRLYTRRAGEGPPVVVLHGGPGAHHDYLLPQYDHLTAGGRALLYYYQRGAGRSPHPAWPAPTPKSIAALRSCYRSRHTFVTRAAPRR